MRAVPASIIDELSSGDVTVQEGDTVVLICNVTGVPTPDVTWFRRPANKMAERESKTCQIGSVNGPGTDCVSLLGAISSLPLSAPITASRLLYLSFLCF